ncbi:hypothetical protein Kpho02_59730 [Kitasatospora phosalacinea]|uniref:Uncharacterized protein n=1 Tax=Kitasatospora phosalacinea TaxID=2065 RepID=A0A9W6QEP8_9ACTN|nr:hypothetical protein [Kitasatospora phosalacinea]GLW73674.1 hypothetical protein Kpho02_59730 [Kitasatospora phosalacinea]
MPALPTGRGGAAGSGGGPGRPADTAIRLEDVVTAPHTTTTVATTAPSAPAPVLASAASAIARRGLFAEEPLIVGDEAQEWALWLTGMDEIIPMPSLGEALIEAAEHNAVATDLDDGSPFNAVVHAVVLHHGVAWRRPRQARTASVRPHVVHSAWCAICDEPLDDEYGYYESPEDVVAVARDRDWKTLPGGELVCPQADPAHLSAEDTLATRATRATVPAIKGQGTLDLPAAPAPARDSSEAGEEYPVGRYLIGARLNRAPAPAATPAPAAVAPDSGTGYLTRISERTRRLTAEGLLAALADVPGHAVVEMAGYPLTGAEYIDGVLGLHA